MPTTLRKSKQIFWLNVRKINVLKSQATRYIIRHRVFDVEMKSTASWINAGNSAGLSSADILLAGFVQLVLI